MSKYPVENGLEKSDSGALSDSQRKDLRQLKVDVQRIDENYIRVRCIGSLPINIYTY